METLSTEQVSDMRLSFHRRQVTRAPSRVAASKGHYFQSRDDSDSQQDGSDGRKQTHSPSQGEAAGSSSAWGRAINQEVG